MKHTFIITALLLSLVATASAQVGTGVSSTGRDVHLNRAVPTPGGSSSVEEEPQINIEDRKREDELARGINLIYRSRNHQYSSDLSPKAWFGKWGFADRADKMVIKARYDDVEPFSEGMARVKKNGKYGFVNEKGELIVDTQYDDATDFFFNPCAANGGNHLSICKLNDKYGVVKDDGSIYVPFEYSRIENLNNVSCIAVKEGSKEANTYMYLGGSAYIYEFDKVTPLKDAIILAEKEGKTMFIDIDGDVYPDMTFDEFSGFQGYDLAVVKRNGKYGILNSDLQYLVPCICPYYEFNYGKHLIGKSMNAFGVCSEGKMIIPHTCSETNIFPFASAIAYKKDNGKFDIIDYSGVCYFRDANNAECINEEGTTLSVSYDGYTVIWDTFEGNNVFKTNKTECSLPQGFHDFHFDGAIIRFVGQDGNEGYVSKKGKRLTDLENADEVRTLNDKYLAVCLTGGQKTKKRQQEEAELMRKYTSGNYPVGTGFTMPVWVVTNTDGEILTGNKQFIEIGNFDAKGNLPYATREGIGKMRLNGNKVTYVK